MVVVPRLRADSGGRSGHAASGKFCSALPDVCRHYGVRRIPVIMRSFFLSILRFRVLVIVAVVLMTVFLALQIKNLKIVINPTTMLPQHHPNVIGTNSAEELFGSKHVVVIGVSAANGETALTPEVLTVIEAFSNELPKIEGVKGHTLMSLVANKAKAISGKAEEMVIEPMLEAPFTQESIDSLENRIESNPIYQGTLVSA